MTTKELIANLFDTLICAGVGQVEDITGLSGIPCIKVTQMSPVKLTEFIGDDRGTVVIRENRTRTGLDVEVRVFAARHESISFDVETSLSDITIQVMHLICDMRKAVKEIAARHEHYVNEMHEIDKQVEELRRYRETIKTTTHQLAKEDGLRAISESLALAK